MRMCVCVNLQWCATTRDECEIQFRETAEFKKRIESTKRKSRTQTQRTYAYTHRAKK